MGEFAGFLRNSPKNFGQDCRFLVLRSGFLTKNKNKTKQKQKFHSIKPLQ